jgi:hypothetical protein
MVRGGGGTGQFSGGRRPGGRRRWLEVSSDLVNRFEGFREEGAHRGSSSTTACGGGGAPSAAGRRGGGGHRLKDYGASWTWGSSCGGDTRVGGGRPSERHPYRQMTMARGRAEWVRARQLLRERREHASPTDHDSERIRVHGVAHVADAHGGAQATDAWPSSCHVRVRPVTGQPVKRCLTLTSGPWPLFDFSRFSNTQILKFEMVIFPMSKFLQMF